MCLEHFAFRKGDQPIQELEEEILIGDGAVDLAHKIPIFVKKESLGERIDAKGQDGILLMVQIEREGIAPLP